MTEVPIEVGYRSYIRLLRKKWDMVYHSKDLYFSHANKILEPYYDMHTKEYYGIETNPTRLAIVKFISQFRQGPGIYEPENFKDLLKNSITHSKRVKLRKPFRAGRHQQSHTTLLDACREERYQHQSTKPIVRELLPREHPYKYSLYVEDHPYEKMIGRTWTHIFIPTPPDFDVMNFPKKSSSYSYRKLLTDACAEGHDMIVVEPFKAHFYITLIKGMFWGSQFGIQLLYALSIMYCCQRPHRWKWNVLYFLAISVAHFGLVRCMCSHPLAKYRIPDRFHDLECLNELKYFREFVPTIIHRVVVLFKDPQGEIGRSLKAMKALHLINFFVLGYNYLYGIDHWYKFCR